MRIYRIYNVDTYIHTNKYIPNDSNSLHPHVDGVADLLEEYHDVIRGSEGPVQLHSAAPLYR
jgi:hypothetical protein